MKQFHTKTILACFLALSFTYLKAQEVDLFKQAEDDAKKKDTTTQIVEGTFKSTRVINGHSVETNSKHPGRHMRTH